MSWLSVSSVGRESTRRLDKRSNTAAEPRGQTAHERLPGMPSIDDVVVCLTRIVTIIDCDV